MNTHYYFFTEEESMMSFIKACKKTQTLENKEFVNFNGKDDLKNNIRNYVEGLIKWDNSDENIRIKIIVLVDQDNDNCKQLKNDIKNIIKSNTGKLFTSVIEVIIVCRELEAWYFGDYEAILVAYPKFSSFVSKNNKWVRESDKRTKPSKHLLEKLNEVSKVQLAKKIAPHISTDRNISASFKHFVRVIDRVQATS